VCGTLDIDAVDGVLQAPLVASSGLPSTSKARVAVLGASGYTGEEVVRLLALHPVFDVTVLTGDRQAGKVRFPLQ
jgi:Semialdehyde dehydrogenase, NAD binding domain